MIKFRRRHILPFAAGVAALSFLTIIHQAWSQATELIKVVVTFPPRSGGDLLTRAVTEQISRTQRRPFAIENQSAALGTETVARAAPDGNTLVVLNNNFVVDSHFR